MEVQRGKRQAQGHTVELGPWGVRGAHPVFESLGCRPFDWKPAGVQPLPLSFGQAKVADLGHQVLGHEDVPGSQVSMHQLLALQVFHALGHVPGVEGWWARGSGAWTTDFQGQAPPCSMPRSPCPREPHSQGKLQELGGVHKSPAPRP